MKTVLFVLRSFLAFAILLFGAFLLFLSRQEPVTMTAMGLLLMGGSCIIGSLLAVMQDDFEDGNRRRST